MRYFGLSRQSAGGGRRSVAPSRIGAIIAGLVATGVLTPAGAQQTDPGADPGRIEERIEELRPERAPAPAPELGVPVLPPTVGAEEIDFSFVLGAVVIEGATAIPADQFVPLYEDLLAQRIGRTEVEALVAAVTTLYRDRGYPLSRAEVPPQAVRAGVLRIRVVEGFVERIEVAGADGASSALNHYLAGIEAARPLDLATLERGLLLINDLPGYTVRRTTVAESGSPGGYVLTVDVAYDRFDALAYLDNRGTPEVGRLQALASGGANSVLGLGERLQLTVFTVPNDPKELGFVEGRADVPIGDQGTMAMVRGAYSDSEPGRSLALLDTRSTSTRFGIKLRHPVLRSRDLSLWLAGGFDLLNAREKRLGATFFDDRLRVARASVDIAFADGWGGANFASLEYSQGLDIFGASRESSLTLSRPDGDPTFSKATLELVRLQDVIDRVQLRFGAKGQIAGQPLLSSEEIGIGGSQFGRAYDFSELTGDDGVAGSLELRYTPDLPLPGEYQFYAFYDVGAVHNKGGGGWPSLSSAGGGLRWSYEGTVQASIEFAKPLTRDVTIGGDRGLQIWFSASLAF